MFGGYLIPDSAIATSLGTDTNILSLIIFIQVALGGVFILYMDEIVSKWGIGSGVSLFIVAGVGSTPFFGVAPYLASLFYRENFHVVILPSPISWNFALSASHSGAPGYAPEDARDLYTVMQRTLATLKDRYDLRITTIDFMGVSLGALEGAYLSVIDAEGKVGIAKYLLVNPPIDLAYAIKQLDQWNALASKFGPVKSQELVSKALAIVDSFSGENQDDPEIFDRFVKKFGVFTKEEIQFLVARSLQSQLPELVYVTQAIHDQNVLSAPKDEMRTRLEEAKKFTLSDYNERIGLPLWRSQAVEPQTGLESFVERSSLVHILDRLRNNPKVYIMHNADNFLINRKSIEELKDALGDRVVLYPYGGHLGNIWYPQNKRDALEIFKSAPGAPAQVRR
jgi:pimeloyl-ACP methyl ester carboxylesterase